MPRGFAVDTEENDAGYFSLGGTTPNVVVDASKSPKSLTVTEPTLGCRWNAVAP